jgi:hypothetical protein
MPHTFVAVCSPSIQSQLAIQSGRHSRATGSHGGARPVACEPGDRLLEQLYVRHEHRGRDADLPILRGEREP